jgi:hypothetical protein
VAHLSPKLKVRVAKDLPVKHHPRTYAGAERQADSPFLIPGQAVVFLCQNGDAPIVFSDDRNPHSLLQFRNQRVAFQTIQLSWQCHNPLRGINTAWQGQSNGIGFRLCLRDILSTSVISDFSSTSGPRLALEESDTCAKASPVRVTPPLFSRVPPTSNPMV